MINNYTFKKLIGSGSFGQIYLAYDKINLTTVAIKKIPIKDFKKSTIDMILTEIKIGYYHNCKYIAKVKNFFLNDKIIYIVMDYFPNSDLSKFKKKRSFIKDERKNFILSIVLGIQYLHINKVIHRDIKLDNILVGDNIALLTDFGTCRILPENKYFTSTCIGTPYYLSPEVISGDKYNTKVDIYSLGCVFCEMYYNKLPFNADNINALYKNIIQSKKNVFIDKTTKIGKLVNCMIDKDSFNRPLIDEVIVSLGEIYNLNNYNTYKKDNEFYNNLRKNTAIPKNYNELNLLLQKIKSSKNIINNLNVPAN